MEMTSLYSPPNRQNTYKVIECRDLYSLKRKEQKHMCVHTLGLYISVLILTFLLEHLTSPTRALIPFRFVCYCHHQDTITFRPL